MDKKQILITLLEKLWEQWLPANWLILLIKNQDITPETIEGLYQVMRHAFQHTTEESAKRQLEKWVSYVQRLMEAEQQDKQQEAAELVALESLLDTF